MLATRPEPPASRREQAGGMGIPRHVTTANHRERPLLDPTRSSYPDVLDKANGVRWNPDPPDTDEAERAMLAVAAGEID